MRISNQFSGRSTAADFSVMMKKKEKEILKRQAIIAEQNINKIEERYLFWKITPIVMIVLCCFFSWSGLIVGLFVGFSLSKSLDRCYKMKNENLRNKYKIKS